MNGVILRQGNRLSKLLEKLRRERRDWEYKYKAPWQIGMRMSGDSISGVIIDSNISQEAFDICRNVIMADLDLKIRRVEKEFEEL